MPTYENEPAAGTAGLAKYITNGTKSFAKSTPTTQAQNDTKSLICELQEFIADELIEMQVWVDCAHAAETPDAMVGALSIARQIWSEIDTGIDEIRELEGHRSESRLYPTRIESKKLYEHRSFQLSRRSLDAVSRLAEALADDWTVHARPEQLPPDGAWNIWLILSGRGWGKTRTGAEWVKALIVSGQARRVALVGATSADVRDTMIEGQSGLLSVCSDWDRPNYEPSKRRVTFKNGAVCTAYSAEEADRLRGPQHDFAWADELAAWSNIRDTWDQLQFGLRLGKKPRICVTTTPRPVPLLKELIQRPDVHVTKGKTSDNAENLAETFLSAIVGRYEGTRLGRQELDGDILDDVPGALWSRDLIESCRVSKGDEPAMRRIVVAIDPAVSVSETSDATGIIVAGLGADGHGYVLQDLSGKYSPTEWARRAIGAYRLHKADRIVAEQNQGGLMVETTLHAVDRNAPVKLVNASKGKITRAEPISALYEQQRIHHVGCFPHLEDEMCSYEAGSSDSPDRLDAAVWAMTELIVLGRMLVFTPEFVAAVSRPGPSTSRYGKPMRFDRRPRGAPLPLGGMTGNFSDRFN